MKLAADIARCQDALDNNCHERKQCKRWVLRHHNSTMTTPWMNYAQCRTDAGCTYLIRLEAANAGANE